MQQLKAIIAQLESFAPPAYQESYDNAQLLTGNPEMEIVGILTTLDVIESVVDEAIRKNCNLIVAHHPIIFSGLKKLTGSNYVERTIIKAIQNNIAIYAIHTNLDHVHTGVNRKIGQLIGIEKMQVLQPKKGILKKLYVTVQENNLAEVRNALFAVGAGRIGEYSLCSFSVKGMGTFKGSEKSNPTVGEIGLLAEEPEHKLEVLFSAPLESAVLKALRKAHTYEEIAYEIITLDNQHQDVGAGMIGALEEAVSERELLAHLKNTFRTGSIRHTALRGEGIQRIAWCGGAGQFLLQAAIRAGADAFISADFKYHEFFDADNRILIADIGHYESEQFTKALLQEYLQEKFPNFAVLISELNTNPIKYF